MEKNEELLSKSEESKKNNKANISDKWVGARFLKTTQNIDSSEKFSQEIYSNKKQMIRINKFGRICNIYWFTVRLTKKKRCKTQFHRKPIKCSLFVMTFACINNFPFCYTILCNRMHMCCNFLVATVSTVLQRWFKEYIYSTLKHEVHIKIYLTKWNWIYLKQRIAFNFMNC